MWPEASQHRKYRETVGSVTSVIFALLEETNKLRNGYLTIMKRFLAATFLVQFSALLFTPALFAQQDQTETTRKIVNRVTPQYPAMARTMNLRGSVKAEAVVQPNGMVKSVEVKGGHPVLVEAVQHAIYKWKWAPASRETRELIEVKFDPQ